MNVCKIRIGVSEAGVGPASLLRGGEGRARMSNFLNSTPPFLEAGKRSLVSINAGKPARAEIEEEGE